MDEGENVRVPRRRWLRLIGRGLLVILVVGLIFHRPILFRLGRTIANRFAADENLKVDCVLEGTIFTGLVIRNLHVVPTGPSIVESLDVDYIRADYSLWDLWRQGMTEALKDAEVRTARIVLNPANERPKPKEPKKRTRLFPVFPERLRMSDINLRVRSGDNGHDLTVEHLDLNLDPKNPGEFRIGTLQLPGTSAWKNISARTSYTNKNLVLGSLVLDDENQFRLLAIDASKLRSKSLELVIDATVAGGTVAGSVALSETARSLETKIRLVAEHLSLDKLKGYVSQSAEGPGGDVQRLTIESSGAIDSPRTWDAKLEGDIGGLRFSHLAFERCVVNVTAHDGVAMVNSAELVQGPNKISFAGRAELPAETRFLGQTPATFTFSGQLPDLNAITAGFDQQLSGSINLEGRAEISDATLHLQTKITGGPIGFDGGTIAQVDGTILASRKMPSLDAKQHYYTDLQTQTQLKLTDLHFKDYAIDSVEADLRSNNASVKLEHVIALRNQNNLTITGDYQLPDDPAAFQMQPVRCIVSVNAPNLADYWSVDDPNKLTGPLQAWGELVLLQGKAQGQMSVYGSNLTSRDLTISTVSGQISIWENKAYLNDLTVSLNDHDSIGGTGLVALERPFTYTGKLHTNIADLARLKPLLAVVGNTSELAGSLLIDWEGTGQAIDFKNSGQLKLKLEKGRYADLRALEANIDANYTPEGLEIPIIFLKSDKVIFQAILTAKGSTLEISKIQIDQGQAKYASGFVSLPFVWKNIGTAEPVIPSDGNVIANFQSEQLDLKRLFEDLGLPARATGLVNVKLDAQGTLAQLQGRLDVKMTDLRSTDYAKLEPASLDLVAQLQNNQLALNGKLQQAKIQPVQITANLPVDIPKIISERKFDEATPVNARVEVPRSPVNFLRQFIPGITQLDGDLTLNANVTGTVAKPSLSGSGDITINMARFNNPTLPSLSGFRSHLTFNGDALNFERFNGDLAGGPFTITGRVTFPKLTQPNLDFQLKAQSILVARNDSLTARADADLKVAGLWSSATVTGTVALTNSQFLKNIDLIPIGLPGRPVPQPPSDRPNFSITDPPLRDWKFDIKVKTKDPFLIRGNLANGGAVVDLAVGGTGLRPTLQGLVRMQKVEATLPFSRMEVAQGFLYFDPSDSFNPRIDLQGVSLIRDYTVHVYVYGTSLSPEAIFTSEPPLPQEEIISLLATGVTRGELTGNNNVLAGRAAMLLVQQVYQKIFKKGQTSKPNSTTDRLQVDIGNVDPRTGQQTATARFKVNDKFVVIGDLAVGGDFRGMVKYLIRFK